MTVPATKRPVYIRLDDPDQWIENSRFWRAAVQDELRSLMFPITSVLAWGWDADSAVASGERFAVILRGPLTGDASAVYSIEELVPGNRDVDKYLFDT